MNTKIFIYTVRNNWDEHRCSTPEKALERIKEMSDKGKDKYIKVSIAAVDGEDSNLYVEMHANNFINALDKGILMGILSTF
jgi:chlorite dismutase